MFGAGESDGVPLGLVLNGAAVVGEFDQVDLDEGDVGFDGELDFSEFETSEGRTWRTTSRTSAAVLLRNRATLLTIGGAAAAAAVLAAEPPDVSTAGPMAS